MCEGPILKKLIIYSLPLMATFVLQLVFNATDIAVLGILVGVDAVAGAYMPFFVMGLITVITEWKYINCTAPRKIWSLFTFPLYMFTWIPIGIVALFKKVEWTPIKHNVVKNVDEIKKK